MSKQPLDPTEFDDLPEDWENDDNFIPGPDHDLDFDDDDDRYDFEDDDEIYD